MAENSGQRKSLAQRRQTVQIQLENMIRELRTKYRKRFIFVIGLLTLSLVALIMVVVLRRHKSDQICNSSYCQYNAIQLYRNLNTDIDPCEDFFMFACGGWIKNNPRPEGKQRWNAWSSLREKVKAKIIAYFNIPGKSNSNAIQKTINFYRSCVDIESRNQKGIHELIRLLNSNGGFPTMLTSWESNDYDWQSATSLAMLSGYPFFNFRIVNDFQTNYTTRIIEIDPSFFPMGQLLTSNSTRDLELKEELRYQKKVKRWLRVLNKNIPERQVDNDIDEVIELEKSLHLLKSKSYDLKRMNIIEMHQMFPKIEWFKIFFEIFQTVGITITNEEPIIVVNTHYFKNLGTFLHSINKRAIANLAALKTIRTFEDAIPEFYENQEEITEHVVNENCYKNTDIYFGLAINHLYVKYYFDNESLRNLEEFVKHLKASLTLTLQQNKWMDDETKIKAQLKLNKMMQYIALPPSIQSDHQLDSYYEDTGFISSENYFNSLKKLMKWMQKQSLKEIRQGFDQRSNAYTPTTINAFYDHKRNKIELTSGILQPPLFYSNSPILMNFASIGSVIGHEITHGFDIRGYLYNEKGDAFDWWSNETKQMYHEKVACFEKQYSQYTEPKTRRKLNSKKTLPDDIADNGGLRQAYFAYKIYISTHEVMDQKLPPPMDQFSKDQLFFITYSNVWCGDDSKEYIEKQIKYKTHSPRPFRVNIPLSNSDEFSEAFNCKLGSKMNPKEKCSLW